MAYPTETFYGLGADGQIEDAIKKIFLIKGRNFKNPISVIIGNANDVRGLVEEIPEFALHLMETFWPGALTIIFKASSDVSPLLTAGTGKIGIRLSIGARAREVLFQFLVEAIMLAAIGGVIGVGVGVGAAKTMSHVNHWPVLIAPFTIMIAMGFSAAIGIFFGFYPAWRASRLNPIDALRYE